jgi:hypothetical protein
MPNRLRNRSRKRVPLTLVGATENVVSNRTGSSPLVKVLFEVFDGAEVETRVLVVRDGRETGEDEAEGACWIGGKMERGLDSMLGSVMSLSGS